jgi:hypothetical protein
MKYIINEMIAEYHQELGDAYQKLSNEVLENRTTAAKDTAETIKALKISIDTLNALLERIESKETTKH